MSESKDEKEYCEQPTLNLKCVALSLATAAFYWYTPPKNKWVLLSTLYFPYLGLAWYDYYYDCKRHPLRPTYLSLFYHMFKPKDSQQIKDFNNWCPEIKRKILMVDLLVLISSIFIIFPQARNLFKV